ncbi:hypothetical protein [Acetobacter garciniae]|nr:hypothetical protein [Acetobacter garciniae]
MGGRFSVFVCGIRALMPWEKGQRFFLLSRHKAADASPTRMRQAE